MTIMAKVLGIAAAFTAAYAAGSAGAATNGEVRAALSQRIASGMRFPTAMRGEDPSGLVRVGFSVGDDGRTHDVRVLGRSGSAELDREAVRMISTFRNLPVPDGDRRSYAVLQYGSGGQTADDPAMKAQMSNGVRLAYEDAARETRLAAEKPASDAVLAYNDPHDGAR